MKYARIIQPGDLVYGIHLLGGQFRGKVTETRPDLKNDQGFIFVVKFDAPTNVAMSHEEKTVDIREEIVFAAVSRPLDGDSWKDGFGGVLRSLGSAEAQIHRMPTDADRDLAIALVRPSMKMEQEGRDGRSSIDTAATIKQMISDHVAKETAALNARIAELTAFVKIVSDQDWSGCQQCSRNIDEANKLLKTKNWSPA